MTELPERLPDEVVEALSSGREDLVDDAILAALPEREGWRAQVAEARALSIDLGLALREASAEASLPQLDLQTLVADAIAAQPVAPSKRSLIVSAVLGLAATLGLAGASLAGFKLPTPGDLFDLGRWAAKFFGAVDRLVDLVPGSWATIGAALAVGLMMLVVPARALARGRLRGGAVAGVLLAVMAMSTGDASAQTFTGEWPDDEANVTLSVEDQPVREVLRQAAESAGLNVVSHIEDNPIVSVHVRDASFRDVVAAVLPHDAVEVRRNGTMVVIRQRAEEAAAVEAPTPAPAAVPPVPSVPPVAPAPSVAPVPAPPSIPSTGPPSGDLPERTTFGADVVVAAGERVRSVVTMGGDADIIGEVSKDVVSMGGDVHVRSGAIVYGDVMTMGGDLHVETGGEVRGRMATMGGEVHVQEGAEVAQWVRTPRLRPDQGGRFMQRAVSSGASFGLLFLLGLVLVGSMRERHANLVRAVVKQPIRSWLTGFLGVIGVVVGTVVLVITVIGIPGAVVVGLGGFLGAYAGVAVSASVIGAALPITWLQNRPVAQLGAGVAILYACWLIPAGIGKLVVLLVATLGFGAILLTRFGKRTLDPGPIE